MVINCVLENNDENDYNEHNLINMVALVYYIAYIDQHGHLFRFVSLQFDWLSPAANRSSTKHVGVMNN